MRRWGEDDVEEEEEDVEEEEEGGEEEEGARANKNWTMSLAHISRSWIIYSRFPKKLTQSKPTRGEI